VSALLLVGGCGTQGTEKLPSRPASIAVDGEGRVLVAAEAGIFTLEGTPELGWARDRVQSPAIAIGTAGPFVVYTASADGSRERPQSVGLYLQVGGGEATELATLRDVYADAPAMHAGGTALVPVEGGFLLFALLPLPPVLRRSLVVWRLDGSGSPVGDEPLVVSRADADNGVTRLAAGRHDEGALVVYRTAVGGHDAGVSSVVVGAAPKIVSGPSPIVEAPWSNAVISDRAIEGRHLLCGNEVLRPIACARLDNGGTLVGTPIGLGPSGTSGADACAYGRPAIATVDDRWLVAHCVTEGSVSVAFGLSSLSHSVLLTWVDAGGEPGKTSSTSAQDNAVGDIVALATPGKTVVAWGDGDAGRWASAR
jgi:hypothetical protein